MRRTGKWTLMEAAAELGVSHASIIVIERKATGKLVLGLGLMTYEELPWRIRKFLTRKEARRFLRRLAA